jgi:hypothetical protein
LPLQFAAIAEPPAHLFSNTQIPPSPHLQSIPPGTHQWLGMDSAARYRHNPHPLLGADDVTYEINPQGYRTGDLRQASEVGKDALRVVCIGSSGAFGAGLPQSATFPSLVRALIEDHLQRPVVLWNLSLGGTGADYVTRMLFSAIPVLRPNFVLLTCYPFNRREYIGETGRIFVASATPHWQQRFTDPGHWVMDKACAKVCNPYTDLTNFVTNLKVWESLCDDAGIAWLFTTEGYASQLAAIEFLLREPRKMVGPGIHALISAYRSEPATGLARDMLHAGTRPNQELAQALFARLIELYAARLEAIAQG